MDSSTAVTAMKESGIWNLESPIAMKMKGPKPEQMPHEAAGCMGVDVL